MDYAKLIDDNLVPTPHKLRVGETMVYNPTEGMLIDAGYKPVTYSDPPEVEPGYVAVPGWEETEDAIIQTWHAEPEGDIDPSEVLDILLGGGEV